MMSTAFELGVRQINLAIESAFKMLLEEKHLYQSVSIDLGEAARSTASRLASVRGEDAGGYESENENAASLAHALVQFSESRWICSQSTEYRVMYRRDSYAKAWPFTIPMARLFCQTCRRREPFNVVKADDYLYEGLEKPPTTSIDELALLPSRPTDQAFVVSLLCQGCQKIPEVLLIRRFAAKNRLVLSGRTPIAAVELPAYIKGPEEQFYEGAIVAFQTGRTLAAAFYLRTFIEQFARRVSALEGRLAGDEIMEAYASKIPQELRSVMPSLRDWYAKLSEDIHAARGDKSLFTAALDGINRHFDMRRAFGL
jgi:hypothetical protein